MQMSKVHVDNIIKDKGFIDRFGLEEIQPPRPR